MSKTISTLFICLFLVLGNANLYAQTASKTNICNTNEVVIVFFNGIKNTYVDALCETKNNPPYNMLYVLVSKDNSANQYSVSLQ